MAYLLLVSVLWGFSFGLIKAEFAQLSPATLASARLLIALPCFLPFLQPRFRRWSTEVVLLLLIGAVQYGVMYLALFHAFAWLSGYEVALLTLFTPLYVILAHALLTRTCPPFWFWGTALLAVIGALVIFRPEEWPAKGPGILLMQVSNICFALGQIAWRHQRQRLAGIRDVDCFALLYAGGAGVTLIFALPGNPVAELAGMGATQWWALIYLGAVASGLAFFLWNAGAARVNPATLAVFNNLKIPLATLIAVWIFGETANWAKLGPGLLLLLVSLGWAEWAWRRSPTRSPGG